MLLSKVDFILSKRPLKFITKNPANGACQTAIDIALNNKEDFTSKYKHLSIFCNQFVSPWSNECLTKFYEFRKVRKGKRLTIMDINYFFFIIILITQL